MPGCFQLGPFLIPGRRFTQAAGIEEGVVRHIKTGWWFLSQEKGIFSHEEGQKAFIG